MIMRYGECANNDYGIIDIDNELSYGEEYRIDEEINYYLWHNKLEDQLEKGEWVQKTGETINITEMTNSHIKNCINMLNRYIEKGSSNEFTKLWIDKFEKELAFRQYIKNIINGTLD